MPEMRIATAAHSHSATAGMTGRCSTLHLPIRDRLLQFRLWALRLFRTRELPSNIRVIIHPTYQGTKSKIILHAAEMGTHSTKIGDPGVLWRKKGAKDTVLPET